MSAEHIYIYIYVVDWGWGVEGKQVGSMDEESQVRGCYNFYLYTNQPGNSICIGKDKQTKHLEQESKCKI